MVIWKINFMHRYTDTGAVCMVNYSIDVEEDGEFVRGEAFEIDLAGDVTIPYENLTEADVIGFVKTTLGADEVTAKENKVTLSGKSEGLPW